MFNRKYSDPKQETIVDILIDNIEVMDEDEFEASYKELMMNTSHELIMQYECLLMQLVVAYIGILMIKIPATYVLKV
ncbi:hypothetical protein MHH33_01535 [Paenisporosarcina sp. FSL H8-0542]|uniref:hypothetical protein n=1 Tax=Paenisporosarcina sp. FSL H8-0542 TaxID=2921401 RepID=UPI00315A83EE